MSGGYTANFLAVVVLFDAYLTAIDIDTRATGQKTPDFILSLGLGTWRVALISCAGGVWPGSCAEPLLFLHVVLSSVGPVGRSWVDAHAHKVVLGTRLQLVKITPAKRVIKIDAQLALCVAH